MPQSFAKSAGTFLKRFAYERRGEIALALLAAAVGVMTLAWFYFFAVGARPAEEPRRAPGAGLKPEIFEELRSVVEERGRDLEKVFERQYPDPFAPRSALPTSPAAEQQ